MARIADILARGRTFSFEFFPPKTDEAERQLERAVEELSVLEPSFVSVTYGALGSTRDRTRDVVVRINRERPFPAMAHLTCVGHTREALVSLLDEYDTNGVENILALAGDPPADGSVDGELHFAIDLIKLVRERGPFSVGVAAHPELHPRSPDRESDRRHLARKLAAADFGITQFFFRIDDYLRMVDELDALGCTTPVIPGVMPFVSVAGVRRMSAMNNTTIPPELETSLDAVEGDDDAVRRLGVDVATELTAGLLAAGVPGVHFYALNRSESVLAIYDKLGLSRPERPGAGGARSGVRQ